MNGWRLVGLLSLLLMAMSLWLLASHAGDIEGIRLVIRATARTSLVLFVMAFTASALVELIPSDATRWQRRNRRYLGVTFAASHAIHAVAIVCFAAMDPANYAAATSAASYIFGGIGYAFIIAMAATSFDRAPCSANETLCRDDRSGAWRRSSCVATHPRRAG